MLFLNLFLSFSIFFFCLSQCPLYVSSSSNAISEHAIQFLKVDSPSSSSDTVNHYYTISEQEDREFNWASPSSHIRALKRSRKMLESIRDLELPDHVLTHPYSYSIFSRTMNKGSLSFSSSFSEMFFPTKKNHNMIDDKTKELDSFHEIDEVNTSNPSANIINGQILRNSKGQQIGAHLLNSNQFDLYDEAINRLQSIQRDSESMASKDIDRQQDSEQVEGHPILSLILSAHNSEEALIQLLENECESITKDYWSYEYCFRKYIRQFHIEIQPDHQMKMDPNWSLGSFTFEVNQDNINRTGEDSLSDYSANLLMQHYEGGQMCYEIDAPRSTRVILQCCDHLNLPLALHSNNFYYFYQDKYAPTSSSTKFQSSIKNKSQNFKFMSIQKVEEVSQCKYEISVCSPLLCTPPSSLIPQDISPNQSERTHSSVDNFKIYEDILPSYSDNKKRMIQTKNQIITEFLSLYSSSLTSKKTSHNYFNPLNFYFNSNFILFLDVKTSQIYGYNLLDSKKDYLQMSLNSIKKDKKLLTNFLNNLYFFSKKNYQTILTKILIKKLRKVCLIYPKDWWTYEICLNGQIKQMRLSHTPLTLPDGKTIQKQVIESEYSLGKKNGIATETNSSEVGLSENNNSKKSDFLEEITDKDIQDYLLALKFKSYYRIIPVEIHSDEDGINSESKSNQDIDLGANSNFFHNLGFISPLYEGAENLFANLQFESLPPTSTFDQILFDTPSSSSSNIPLPSYPHLNNQLSFSFTNGTPCDLLDIPRSSIVHLRCGSHDRVLSVTETSTCKYEIEVELLTLCGFPSFKPLDIKDSTKIVFSDLDLLNKDIDLANTVDQEVESEFFQNQRKNEEKESSSELFTSNSQNLNDSLESEDLPTSKENTDTVSENQVCENSDNNCQAFTNQHIEL